ncbi:uncharacterized protein LOC123302590 isoform X2 [Chrysoperla carnea]|uniref:uncharacterized protein LOC123302590 isoform X2 n=1 Tax=Chrysoperla carnea TaxID=189513 RepID=UPI001D066064|nr:uncharacterized protein LOC123302590 isoform X2 [Chrysoperla carnea]
MSGDFNYFLTICLLSSCFFGATYSQRKVNRNAATGSEGKQVVDFDCPEEFGYYPHPTDCTQYYVCVFGGALLESCTGGLMYSHELQTCDWPRNVGCDAAGTSAVQQSSPDHTPSRQQQSNSGRYAQTQQQTGSLQSRGQTRQQFPTQQQQLPTLRQEEDYQYKKQKQHQQQLYAVAESDLPPVEEIESDRQQRVYRGQPSTVGQVQRDRDALRHTNAIPVQNIRNSKIGVISFGTQQQQSQQQSHIEQPQYRIEPSTLAPEQYAPAPRPVSITTAGNSGNTGRALYNTTSAQNYDQNQYDPYYALYDDDVELYRDVADYGHNYNTAPISESPKQVYRGTPATQPQPVESATVSSRAPAQYIQQDTVPYNVHPQQTLYKQQVSSINDDYSDVSYEVDANQYQSADRNPGRGDRNDLRFPEPTTKKAVKTTTSTTTTTTTSTTTTTRRPATVSSIRLENITENPSPVVTNGTNKHESIFITLTAKPPRYSPTPFQITSSSPPPTNTLLHTSTSTQQNQQDVTIPIRSSTEIDLDNETTKKPSRFISLTAGFTLLDHDKNVRTQLKDPEHSHDSKHNLQFTQYDHMAINDNIEVSTTDDHEPEIHKPIYQITNLPTQKNETITLQLVSALGASTGTTRHTLPTTTHLSVTETPSYKREIATSHHTKNVIESKTSTYIHPTTYSVPKYFLEALFHKTTPQGFKLTPTTTSTTHKPPSTSTTTSRPRIIKEYFNFDYYDDEYVENNTNNTIPLLPYQPQYTSTTLPKKLRTNDVVILPEKVQKNRFTIERKPTSTESNLRTNRIVINRESAAPVPVLPSALMSDDNLTTNDNNDVITDDDEVTPTTSRTFTDLPNHLPNLPIPTSTTPITIIQSTQTSTTTNLPPVPSTTISTSTSYLTSLPGRVSRINPAIKSITTFGGARGSSKCNGNSTISHIKCNEIQQRTNVRGRGSAHYTSAGEDVPINRGTPPTRSRPTLKPSTSIVSKASEFIDIYKYPPTRPSPVYPTPQVDKSAAKCRKDVCLLPDCYCGGKDIPGDLSAQEIPQIVLLTFDDAVNDLNKGLYTDLFEQGRVNPNGCPITATFYVSHEWTDYSQVQNLYAVGHEMASHTVSHSFGEQFSQKKWNREVAGQREILAAYGGVHLEDVRGMRAPFLSVGGNKMFKMLYDSNFTYDSSMPVYENRPPSWPYTLDYKLFHDCMIPPCPTRSYPGVWEVPMVMWQDLNGGRCSMGDACSNPPAADGVFKMLMKNFDRHYSTNRAPFGLFYHAAWFTQPHHKEGFIQFLDTINAMKDVYLVTNWQAIQWVRDPTPLNRIANFQPFQCNYANRPKKCNNPKVCNLWHKSGVRYMRTCQPCPDIYPWTGKTGIKSSRIDNDIED